MATTVNTPYFTLNNGTKIPAMGLGCFMGTDSGGEQNAYDMILKALKVGYRHLDTAEYYQTEEDVGRAIRDSGIPREEIYVTTKLANPSHGTVQAALDGSLARLGLDYVDLYLVHWPQAVDPKTGRTLGIDEYPTVVDTWKQMEAALETGKVKSIGVSNYSIKTLEIMLPHAKVIPAAIQREIHPCLPENELKEYCDQKGIQMIAYSSLGQALSKELFENPAIQKIADKHNATVPQVLLSWQVQRGIAVIPKSASEERLRKNATLLSLTNEEMVILNDVHKEPGMHKSLLMHYLDDNNLMFGWTFEQLGWNFANDGQVLSK